MKQLFVSYLTLTSPSQGWLKQDVSLLYTTQFEVHYQMLQL